MDQTTKNDLLSQISYLENVLDVSAKEPEREFVTAVLPTSADYSLKTVMSALLTEEGYAPLENYGRMAYGHDYFTERPADEMSSGCKLGIAHKRLSKHQIENPIGVYNSLVEVDESLNRLLLVVNAKLPPDKYEAFQRVAPSYLELVDLDRLRAWVGRVDVASDINQLEIEQILKVTSSRLAKRIAEEPRYVERLNWWEMEQLVSDLFDGLGFKVTLTPSSKDGGKDVILECIVDGKQRSYVVEIKHWRSEQKVGKKAVTKFLNVLVREKRDGGLFLSTYGYANNAFESLTEMERQTLRFGEHDKVVNVCKQYLKLQSGIWSPPTDISTLIFDETV
jgi:restriction system protein